VALGGRKSTLAGLAGLGDLIVTCTSSHSRNRRAGVLIGKGVKVKEAMNQVGAVVEGYYARQSGARAVAEDRDRHADLLGDLQGALQGKIPEGRHARPYGRSRRHESDLSEEKWIV
jgi:glycerol-3-phosphate dehydrogenase (NAD(P)+)